MRNVSEAVTLQQEIPTFPDFRPIELRDREIIRGLLLETPIRASDFAFANLFAWQNGFPMEISRLGNHLLLMERPYNSVPHFLPILGPGSIDATAEAIAEFLPKIAGIPEELIAGYEIFQRKGFRLREDRDNSDYVYSREALAELKGRDYDGKRQQVRKFQEAFAYKFVPLTPEAFDACLMLHRDWTSIKSDQLDNRIYDYELHAVQKAIAHFAELKLLGGVIEVQGRVEAFMIAEPLDSETVVLLFEKANPRFPGIYQVLNWECARKIFKEFMVVNFEQDLGNAGLRRAKESYHPVSMVNKYVLERMT